MLARRIGLNVSYNGKNISKDIAKYITSFSISDAMGGEADKVDITLEDREELWMGDWFPTRGDTLEVGITKQDWDAQGDNAELPFGKFEIDQIKNAGPPNTAQIGAVSIPNNAAIRSVTKTRSWEKTKLSVIENDIAAGAGLEAYFEAADDPVMERAEQSGQTDMEFLMKLCKDAGLALKVTDEKIVIFDEEKYEKEEAVLTITRGKSAVASYDFTSTIRNIYKACHVKYKHGKKASVIEYTYTDPNRADEEGMTLEVNEKVESLEEAEKLAKKKLREKNKDEIKGSMTVLGNFLLLASNTINISGWHVYDGKYIIEKATHSVGSGGYTVSIDIRRCLNGY